MSVEEKFYLLVLDEIRAQPGLPEQANELDLEGYGARFSGTPIDTALERMGRHEELVLDKGEGFGALRSLGPEPSSAGEPDPGEPDYDTLCRRALLHLAWGNLKAAEEKINLAKYLRDDWAFAHYLYGLLRGVQGDLGRAHFELYLAVHRESYPDAKLRIDRALDLVS